MDCLTQIQKFQQIALMNSGRFINQLGQYYQCLENQQMRYNFVNFNMIGSTDNVAFIGLCLPSFCRQDQVQTIVNMILTQGGFPLEVANVENNVPGYNYQFEWTFYLIVAALFICLILVIYSTLEPQKNRFSMFSIQESSKIFKRNPQSNLNVFNGVRSICMMWVVLGHTFLHLVQDTSNFTTSLQRNTILQPFFLLLQSGLLSVDVFFFIAGFLLAYVFLKDITNSPIKYPVAIVQRVLRFWPSYIFAILIYFSIYLHLSSGPLWGRDEQEVQNCRKMWKPLFFVDNLVDNGSKQCMLWGWYLQNDMQLFIVSIILIFIYSLKPIVSKVLIILIIIGSSVFTFLWTMDRQTHVLSHISDFDVWSEYFSNVYTKPWARAPPYVFGLFIGMLYHEYLLNKKSKRNQKDSSEIQLIEFNIFAIVEGKIKEKKYLRVLLQLFGFIIMALIVFIPRTLQEEILWPQWLHSLFISVSKMVFVLALFAMLLPSLLGFKNSMILFTMDTSLFNFIGKISFCTYLIHLTVVLFYRYHRKYTSYGTITPILTQYFGILFISLILGLLMTYMIQVPFSKLQKSLITTIKQGFSRKQVKQREKQPESSNAINYSEIKTSLIDKLSDKQQTVYLQKNS